MWLNENIKHAAAILVHNSVLSALRDNGGRYWRQPGLLRETLFQRNGLKKTIAFFKSKLLRSDSKSNWGNKEYKHLKFRGDS